MSLYDDCLEALIEVVTRERDANAGREEMYFLMSDKRWKNRDVEDAAEMVEDLATFYIDVERIRERDAIVDAAVQVATGLTAGMISTDRKLYREVDVAIAERCIDVSRTFKLLMRDVEDSKRRDTRSRGDNRRDRDYDDRPRVRSTRDREDTRTRTGSRDDDRRPPNRRRMDEEREARNPVRAAQPTSRNQPEARTGRPTLQEQPTVTTQAPQVAEPSIQQQTRYNRKITPTVIVPHTSVFKTQSQIALWVLKNTTWCEEYAERENDVDYQTHETDRFLNSHNPTDRRHRARAALFTDALRVANQRATVANQIITLTGEPLVGVDEVERVLEKTHVKIDEPLMFTMLDDYITEPVDHLMQMGLSVDMESCVVNYTCVSLLPWGLTEPALVTLVERFASAKTWTDVKTVMVLLSTELSEHYWRKLNQMLTEQINEGVMVRTGLDIVIDNFTQDIDDLRLALIDDLGESGGKVLDSLVDWVVKTTLSPLVTKLDDGTAIHAFTQTYDVTLLPVHSKDIDLGTVGKVGLLSSTAFPQLYGYIHDKFQTIGNTMRYVRLVTSDGAALAVYRGTFEGAYFIGSV